MNRSDPESGGTRGWHQMNSAGKVGTNGAGHSGGAGT